MDKLLSIIVPSYNMEKYLPKCLASVCDACEKKVGQENRSTADVFSLLDIIVVNDGSKDRTSEIAHDFERRYPGVVRVIDKPNGNYGSCVNAALPISIGRFVKILDADDTYDTVAFAEYLKELATMPEDTDMVMNDYVKVDEDDQVQENHTYLLPQEENFASDALIANKCDMAMHAVAYRTELLREIGYKQLEGISYTDTEWFYLPAANAKAIRYIHLTVYRYLIGRVGQTMEQKVWVRNRWMMERIFSRMLDEYDSCVRHETSKAYLAYQLRRMYSLLRYLHMDESVRNMRMAYFESLRPLMRKHDILLNWVREEVLFGRTPIRFHYVEFLVNHPLFTRPVLAFVNWYSCIRAKTRKVER